MTDPIKELGLERLCEKYELARKALDQGMQVLDLQRQAAELSEAAANAKARHSAQLAELQERAKQLSEDKEGLEGQIGTLKQEYEARLKALESEKQQEGQQDSILKSENKRLLQYLGRLSEIVGVSKYLDLEGALQRVKEKISGLGLQKKTGKLESAVSSLVEEYQKTGTERADLEKKLTESNKKLEEYTKRPVQPRSRRSSGHLEFALLTFLIGAVAGPWLYKSITRAMNLGASPVRTEMKGNIEPDGYYYDRILDRIISGEARYYIDTDEYRSSGGRSGFYEERGILGIFLGDHTVGDPIVIEEIKEHWRTCPEEQPQPTPVPTWIPDPLHTKVAWRDKYGNAILYDERDPNRIILKDRSGKLTFSDISSAFPHFQVLMPSPSATPTQTPTNTATPTETPTAIPTEKPTETPHIANQDISSQELDKQSWGPSGPTLTETLKASQAQESVPSPEPTLELYLQQEQQADRLIEEGRFAEALNSYKGALVEYDKLPANDRRSASEDLSRIVSKMEQMADTADLNQVYQAVLVLQQTSHESPKLIERLETRDIDFKFFNKRYSRIKELQQGNIEDMRAACQLLGYFESDLETKGENLPVRIYFSKKLEELRAGCR